MSNTTTLSVFGKSVNCRRLARSLHKAGINCNVTKNIMVRGEKIENGCQVTATISSDESALETWRVVQEYGTVACGLTSDYCRHVQSHCKSPITDD